MFVMDDGANELEGFKRATRAKIEDVRCPYHGRAPHVEFHGTSLREVTISIRGCCPAVMRAANQAVGASPRNGHPAAGQRVPVFP